MNDLEQLAAAARADFEAAPTPAELENAKARYLGKAGRVTELLKALGALPVEQKKTRGAEMRWPRPNCSASCRPRRWTSRCPAGAAARAGCIR